MRSAGPLAMDKESSIARLHRRSCTCEPRVVERVSRFRGRAQKRSARLDSFVAPVVILFIAFAQICAGAAAAGRQLRDMPKLQVKWGQTNTTVTVALDPTKLLSCFGTTDTVLNITPRAPDRIVVVTGCTGEPLVDSLHWDLELREDITVEHSKTDRLAIGGALVTLRKRIQHRWDRLLWNEADAIVSKDWKREDRNVPDEDEVELPRALNIRRLEHETLCADVASGRIVVAALRFPWCGGCVEKDLAFVKATKKVGPLEGFQNVVFGAIDLREHKTVVRRWNSTCHKDRCPLHVFKPDEPMDEPYIIEMKLLYEMDEYSMMSDPLMGAPGHTPQGKAPKPDFDRFEQDLLKLVPPALTWIHDIDQALQFRSIADNVVFAHAVNTTELRQVARRLRGLVRFGVIEDAQLMLDVRARLSSSTPTINRTAISTKGRSGINTLVSTGLAELYASAATPARTPVAFDGSLSPLDVEGLVNFSKIHVMPLLPNYSWELKPKFENSGIITMVLWVNYSDSNSSEINRQALEAFSTICDERRGRNSSRDVVCCVMDASFAYYQREYGTHEPYPFPYVGLTWKVGFGDGDRFGYPFKEPMNATIKSFFSRPKKAARQLGTWTSRVLTGKVPCSHVSGLVPEQPKWVRGTVQEIVWKTYQAEINMSQADVLLELYDNQRKQAHIADGNMRVVAAALKDYSMLKVARMETSQNYIPPVFERKQFSKETEYYWIPPSLAFGQFAPGSPVRYDGGEPITPEKLLRFFKRHTLSHWSLKEGIEVSDDLSPEIMGQAQAEQREEDRAAADKQDMIKKMMTTLKKEKGLVDVGEMMGLKKAAETVKPGHEDTPAKSKKPKKTNNKSRDSELADRETKLAKRREQLRREEERRKKMLLKDKEQKKNRKYAEKRRKELLKAKQAEEKIKVAREIERKRLLREAKERERRLAPTTPYFAWGQAKDQVRLAVSVPNISSSASVVNISDDFISVRARDLNNRLYTLEFELREFIVTENSSWSVRYSERKNLKLQADGLMIVLQKSYQHRWDRLAQNYSGLKLFMKRDWLQLDDGGLEEEEDIDLPAGSTVTRMTSSSLSAATNSTEMIVAALRLPWCPKCVEKDKHFVKASKSTLDDGKKILSSVIFSVVDVREDKGLGRRYNVSCDESCNLFLFKRDEHMEPYIIPGKRYSEEIEIECYKHLLPVVNEIADKATFDRVTSAFETAIVGFFRRDKLSDPAYPPFRAAARELRGHALFGAIFGDRQPLEFGINHHSVALDNLSHEVFVEDEGGSADRSVEEVEGIVSGRPVVLLFKPKEKRHVEFIGELSLEKLTHFSKVLSVPLVSTYDFESRQKYRELKVPLGMMWFDSDNVDSLDNQHAKMVLRRLALQFSGHLVFVELNNTRDGILMRPMGLDPRRAPTFGISRSDEPDAERFGFDMQVTNRAELSAFWADEEKAYQRLESFCSAFKDGTLESSHESAELPPTYHWYGPGIVHEVVWKTFRESVYRTEHHVLLELYNPFRPQHRSHIMVLDLVAEALMNITNLKVARMDTQNNYVLPEFGLTDKEKASTFYFIGGAPERFRKPRRFGVGRNAKAENLPERLLKFVHREMTAVDSAWDIQERLRWVNKEANKRIRRLRALEKDYEKKMQDEWMQKEMEEFERYKQLGRFDNIPGMG